MATLEDLNAALDSLDQSVRDLPARIPAAQDLQPAVDKVNAVKAEVDAINPA